MEKGTRESSSQTDENLKLLRQADKSMTFGTASFESIVVVVCLSFSATEPNHQCHPTAGDAVFFGREAIKEMGMKLENRRIKLKKPRGRLAIIVVFLGFFAGFLGFFWIFCWFF